MTIQAVVFWRTKAAKDRKDKPESGIVINNDMLIIDQNGLVVKEIFDYQRREYILTIQLPENLSQ